MLDTLAKRVEAIDASLVKRPEITALLENAIERIDALSNRMTDMQHQYSDYLVKKQ